MPLFVLCKKCYLWPMVIDGRKIADRILGELKSEVVKIKAIRQGRSAELSRSPQGGPLYLAAVLVGDDSGSRRFLELKRKAAEGIGVECRIYKFPEKISNGELRKKLNQIVKATTCGGMIIELPLPVHLNTQAILNTVPEKKDPDVLSQKAQGTFFAGRSEILPPSVEAVKQIFGEYKIEPKSKIAAVFGYGLLVGKPISHWLTSQGAAVTVISEFTESPAELSKKADIIISGVGKPGLIKYDMVKDGAVVIDFGFASTEKGIVGDVDFEEVSKKASLITPVPGGTGPIVIAAVLKNFVKLVKNV